MAEKKEIVMGWKDQLKSRLAKMIYKMYRHGILKNPLSVADLDKTIEELLGSNKSFVRFGDGEIRLIEGDKLTLQEADSKLAERLKEIIGMPSDGVMTGIPDIFKSLEQYRPESRRFWQEHLLFFRKKYEKYCSKQYQYYDAFFSRLYYMYEDWELSTQRFEKIKQIWKNRDVVVIESKTAHTGVDNDLLVMAHSVKRIICPESNAWNVYGQLYEKAIQYDKNTLFLISAGATAKPLVVDLTKEGYRALDIGSLDMEYQWYMMKATEKCHPPKKNCVTIEQDKAAGYYEYLEQIDVVISGEKQRCGIG